MPVQHWELVLTDVLHSIRSLLSTATNVTPHERFFGFTRRSSSGNSLPSWLMAPGPVLLRRFVRANKNEPLVDQVELLDVNPTYASIRHQDGRESTVSLHDLAPYPEGQVTYPMGTTAADQDHPSLPELEVEDHIYNTGTEGEEQVTPPTVPLVSPMVRRSARIPKTPKRYGWD